MNELTFESEAVIESLKEIGWVYKSSETIEAQREYDSTNVIAVEELRRAVAKLNGDIAQQSQEEAINAILKIHQEDIVLANETFHTYITEGYSVEVRIENEQRGRYIQFIDWENPENNTFVVTNQFTVSNKKTKRPDVVLLVNGMPLVLFELKAPLAENVSIDHAYQQIQNYKNAIPQLFFYNSICVLSDGLQARSGTITSDFSRFLAWKSVFGEKVDETTLEYETLIAGMLRPEKLLDLIKSFTVFEKTSAKDEKTGLQKIKTVKKVSAYHQYFAVNKALEKTIEATSEHGDKKIGVVWHTQGSGKSLSMVFYAGKLVQQLDNPTIVIVTDRNDLDAQLFGTFADCKQLLRQTPQQAQGREQLKELLNVSGGGIIFTTLQKFSTNEGEEVHELLNGRRNIIVIADEAHRSHYGFKGKTKQNEDGLYTTYGFAKYLRDALPNASFVGFTGTPVEKDDVNTPAVFGDYIDVYDIKQAVDDGATVPIYFSSRLAKVHLAENAISEIDYEVDEILEGHEEETSERTKSKWAQLEKVVGNPSRLNHIAKDIIEHFEERTLAFEGKGMIVAMSRRIAVDLYDSIVALRPDWHDEDLDGGAIKVIMTASSADPENWQIHNHKKTDQDRLAKRLRDPADPLRMVIVRDMWLTGFDAPVLHTMYVDKPMRGHNLMQAIARVNRVFKNKPGGLVVDYIGIGADLREARSMYTQGGGLGELQHDQHEAVAVLNEKLTICRGIIPGYNIAGYLKADTREKLRYLRGALDVAMSQKDGLSRLIREVLALGKAYALAVPLPEALEHKQEVAFFEGAKAFAVKFQPKGALSMGEVETAIKQILDSAIVSEDVIDIFDAAGLKKPDVSILSEEFLAEVRGMKHKNVAVEMLKKLLNDDIKVRRTKNIVQSRKYSEMLESAVKRYLNNMITSIEVLEELIAIGKQIQNDDDVTEAEGLSVHERAFYDALAQHDSAKGALSDDILRELARQLVVKIRATANIDWRIRESVRAELRLEVKKLLRKYGYPPDFQQSAVDSVISQAELFADGEVA